MPFDVLIELFYYTVMSSTVSMKVSGSGDLHEFSPEEDDQDIHIDSEAIDLEIRDVDDVGCDEIENGNLLASVRRSLKKFTMTFKQNSIHILN